MCKLIREIDGLLESQTIVKLKDKFEVEDITDNIIGRAVITETKKNLMAGLTNVFSFGKKKEEPEIVIEKNEIKAIIFKRMDREKVIFCEGRFVNQWQLFKIFSNG